VIVAKVKAHVLQVFEGLVGFLQQHPIVRDGVREDESPGGG